MPLADGRFGAGLSVGRSRACVGVRALRRNAHIHTQPHTHVTAAHEPVDLAVVAEYCRTAGCALRDVVALGSLGAQEVSAATATLSEARRLVGQYKVRASPVDGRAESDAVGLLVLRCPTPSCHPLAWPPMSLCYACTACTSAGRRSRPPCMQCQACNATRARARRGAAIGMLFASASGAVAGSPLHCHRG